MLQLPAQPSFPPKLIIPHGLLQSKASQRDVLDDLCGELGDLVENVQIWGGAEISAQAQGWLDYLLEEREGNCSSEEFLELIGPVLSFLDGGALDIFYKASGQVH